MGRPEFSAPGTAGGGQIVAVNDNPRYDHDEYEMTDPVAPGEAEVVEVYAPAGSTYYAHQISVVASVNGSWPSSMTLLSGGQQAVHWASSSSLEMDSNRITGGTSDTSDGPTDDPVTMQAVQDMRATPTRPIAFEFYHHPESGEDQTNPRNYHFMAERRDL